MKPSTLAKKYDNQNFLDLAILVEGYEKDSHGHLYGRIVFIKRDADGNQTVGFFDDSVWDGEVVFQGLLFSAQYNTTGDDIRRPYAISLEYDNYRMRSLEMGLTDGMELKIKYLKSISRKVAKFEDTFSGGVSTKNFSEYMRIVGGLMGINRFISRTPYNNGINIPFDNIWDVDNYIRDKVAGE